MLVTYFLFQTDDFVDFFERCQSGLSPGGLICVKENITKIGVDMDSEDSSVTRYTKTMCMIRSVVMLVCMWTKVDHITRAYPEALPGGDPVSLV